MSHVNARDVLFCFGFFLMLVLQGSNILMFSFKPTSLQSDCSTTIDETDKSSLGKDLELLVPGTDMEQVAHSIACKAEQVSYDKSVEALVSQWKEEQQGFEMTYHLKTDFRGNPIFMENNAKMFKSFGFHEEDYINKIIVDVGAGPKLRSTFWKDAHRVVVEPLGAKYIHAREADLPNMQYVDIDYNAYALYPMPAEKMACQWENKASLVMCINALDHVFDAERSFHLLQRYMKPCGQESLLFLMVDFHEPKKGHSQAFSNKTMHDLFVKEDLEVVKEWFPLPPDVFELMPHKDCYTVLLRRKCSKVPA